MLRNVQEYEHISLKYISYLAKYRNNSPKAYFELKRLLSKRNNITSYFRVISKIMSSNIERFMVIEYQRNISSNQSHIIYIYYIYL